MIDDPLKDRVPTEISDQALRWIVRLNSGMATATDRQQYRAWRAASPVHELAAREAEALWGDATNLHQEPRSGLVRPGARKRKLDRRGVLTGVAIAGIGGGLWAAGVFSGKRPDFATGRSEIRDVLLPDNSHVTLNAHSAINLAFSQRSRRVILAEGEAFFEVTHQTDRPFEVEADGVVVTALGTAFDVDRNLGGGGVAVAVTEHAVTVSGREVVPSARQTVRLEERQAVRVDARGRIGQVTTPSPAAIAAWRSGLYVAEDQSLGDVVAALQAYHAGWIVVRGEATAALRVNAVLSLKTPDESLDTLAGGLPINVHRLSAYLVVITGNG